METMSLAAACHPSQRPRPGARLGLVFGEEEGGVVPLLQLGYGTHRMRLANGCRTPGGRLSPKDAAKEARACPSLLETMRAPLSQRRFSNGLNATREVSDGGQRNLRSVPPGVLAS